MADAAECNGDAVDLGRRGLRIGAIFIIMASSALGALLPVVLARRSRLNVPKIPFFVCKYVGTGVIVATAYMHLLEPAVDNLADECLQPRLGDYPWAFFIALFTVMFMFFVELLAVHYGGDPDHLADRSASSRSSSDTAAAAAEKDPIADVLGLDQLDSPSLKPRVPDAESGPSGSRHHHHHHADAVVPGRDGDVSYPPGGVDHLAHQHSHTEDDHSGGHVAGQLTAIFILEFGVVFHSIFIGLTLGTTDELVILLIVLVFHQLFEGLGLGSRLALTKWPRDKPWLPYLLGAVFALSTPVGIAAGIGARPANANTQKLVNGIFDAISAGILMYTGLVELLAHEFMFNPHMRRAPLKVQLFAFACILFGAGVMALLANWA